MSVPLVVAADLVKDFRSGGEIFQRPTTVRALAGVNLEIARGETLALVGESGSGKTTVGRILLRLIDPTSGTIRFDGIDVFALKREPLRQLRRRMQIVFQDPYGSLNPRMRVGAAVKEPIEVHRLASGGAIRTRVQELFEEVGLDPGFIDRYPHELSGGQRQRVGIARALAVNPEFLVLDEPVSALDVSVQAQVLNLLADLRTQRALTYLFIAHDMAVVRHLASRVVVLYLGRVMESAPATTLYARPTHPYTIALLDAIPAPDPGAQRDRIVLREPGVRVDAGQAGCVFAPRCLHPKKDDRCFAEQPALREVAPQQYAACHHVDVTTRSEG